jgi:riboflavin synthase
MFTGLVAKTGSVAGLETVPGGSRITIECGALAAELAVGDSVAVSGACLTATAVDRSSFTAEVVQETLRRTTLGELGAGATVNLELPLRASDRLGRREPHGRRNRR